MFLLSIFDTPTNRWVGINSGSFPLSILETEGRNELLFDKIGASGPVAYNGKRWLQDDLFLTELNLQISNRVHVAIVWYLLLAIFLLKEELVYLFKFFFCESPVVAVIHQIRCSHIKVALLIELG